MSHFLIHLSIILLYAFVSLAQHTISTTNGQIVGHQANGSDVVEYLGIPYAQPPVGELRFAAPEPYSGNGTYTASSWGPSCPQDPSGPVDFPNLTPQAQRIIYNFVGSKKIPQDEDCLTLNVWTKTLGMGIERLKPVLIFFYGGRFAGGNTHLNFYNGQSLAQHENVVVITINYRVNIFGFPGSPDTTQNLGLRDQRLAVEWIRDNAAAFGGDPEKLTLFGQSSGGVAVDYWAYAYESDPIVHGLISESGNALSFGLLDPNVQTSNWNMVTKAVGCGNSSDTLACMRSKSWQKIEEATADVPPSSSDNPVRSTPPFYPKVDDEIVFLDYVSLAKSGAFAKLPYLLGNNNHEQGFYIIPAYENGVNVTKNQGNEFLLESFTCPNAFEADQRRKYNVPVWLYRYFGHWNNLKLYPGSGAYHGSELEMVFGNSEAVSGIPPSSNEVKTTRLMQHAWATFADDPENGLTGLGWPEYDSESKTLVELAYHNQPTIRLEKPSVFDAKCDSVQLGGIS